MIGDSEDSVDVLTSGGYEMDFSYNGHAGDPEYIRCAASPGSSVVWPLSSVSASTIGIPSPGSITSITLSSG